MQIGLRDVVLLAAFKLNVLRGDIKIQVAVTATVCSRLQPFAAGCRQLNHYERSNIGTHCFNMMINAYLNERNNNLERNCLTTEKRLQIAATLPAAVCERLQLLPIYFDITPYHQSDLFPIEDDFRLICVPLYYKIDIREIKCKVSITIHS